MTTGINVAVTSISTREVSRELTDKELAQVSGGIIAVLIGGPDLSTNTWSGWGTNEDSLRVSRVR